MIMQDLVKIFKALSDSNRIRIIKILEIRSLCVCEITEVLHLATSTVSQHLSLLKDAGIIVDEKDGKWVNYSVNTNNLNQYNKKILPLLKTWLPKDSVINEDIKKLGYIDRNTICGL